MENRETNVCRILVLVMIGLAGCRSKSDQSNQPCIAVANSYLEAAVIDLGIERSKIISLVPPGMCPGHFDLVPSQADRLLSCSVLLVFDFQNTLSSSLPRIQKSKLTIRVVTPPPGLCVPESYLSIVRQTASALESVHLLSAADSESHLKQIEDRLNALEGELHGHLKQAGFSNENVLISQHQEVFARWLGLNPVATFRGRDTETPGSIQSALERAGKNPVRCVIANRQEGTELGESLAKRFSVPLIVFSNFPESTEEGRVPTAFDSLVRGNVQQLDKAVR